MFVEPYRSFLKSIVGKIGYDYDVKKVDLEIPVDHIHVVVRSEPEVSPLDVMQVIKSISARKFFRFYPYIKSKHFLGG